MIDIQENKPSWDKIMLKKMKFVAALTRQTRVHGFTVEIYFIKIFKRRKIKLK